VCDTLKDPKKRLHEVGIELFSPCRPMLGERAKPNEIEKIMSGKQFYIETKFDGERFQMHMSRSPSTKYVYFSRNGHEFTATFGADPFSDGSLTPFIDLCIRPECTSVILDGEMCGYNNREKYLLSLSDEYDVKSYKSGRYEDKAVQTCFCVFDVLYYNGEVLTNRPLRERVDYMQKCFTEIEGSFKEFKKIKKENRNKI